MPQEFTLKDGQTLVVREAEPEDAAALLAYINEVCAQSDFLSFGPGEFELSEAQEQEFLGRMRESPNQIYLIGQIDGSIVSTIHFSSASRSRIRHKGELGMSVHQSYWGQGIGSTMLDVLIAWAQETGIITKINLKVRIDNDRALRLYKSKGFNIEGTISREYFLNGVYYPHHWMGLEL